MADRSVTNRGPSRLAARLRCAGVGFMVAPLLLGIGEAAGARELELHLLDVGYGQALLLRLPDGQDWLVDGGLGIRNADLQKRLRRLKVGRPARVVSTHPHPDHVEGLVGVLEAFGAGRVELNHPPNHPAFYPPLLDYLRRHPEIPWDLLRAGQRLQPAAGVVIDVLHPPELAADLNESSLVFRLSYGRFRFVMGGDVGPAAQAEIAATAAAALECDVLLVPHHGGRGDETFIRTAAPRVGLISVGENAWGNPDAGTLDRYREVGTVLARTDEHGEIRVRTDGERVRVRSRRGGRHADWKLADDGSGS